jgi:anaerobic selenocysteine-containing dehydrogenase
LKSVTLGVAGVTFGNVRSARAQARKAWNAGSERTLRKYRSPKPTVCRVCPAHCAILAYRDGDRVVQIEGNPGSPTNRGGLCARAYFGLERVYDSERILTPLARKGHRGSGEWESISWEEALSRIGKKLYSSKGKKVLHLGQEEILVEELRSHFGWDETLVDEPLSGHPGPGSGEAQYGAPTVSPDVLHARTVYLFGHSVLSGRFQVPLARNLMDAKLKGADIHLFDSVAGSTGSVATWHPVYPGAEGDLALGIARLLFKWGKIDYKALARALSPIARGRENLLDEFARVLLDYPNILTDRKLVRSAIAKMPENPIRRRAVLALMKESPEKKLLRELIKRSDDIMTLMLELVEALDKLEAQLEPYTPEMVMERAQLPASSVVTLARRFSERKPAVAICPPDHHAAPQVSLLNHLIGAVNVPGGTATARGPFFIKPIKRNRVPEHWLSELVNGNATAELYWVSDANPAYDAPQSSEVAHALADEKKVKLLVVMDTHLTETAKLADIFLPLATSFESWGLLEGVLPDGRSYLYAQQPVTRAASEASKLKDPASPQLSWFEPWAKPLGQARSISDVLAAMAHARNPKAAPFKTTQDYMGELLIKSWGPGSLEALRMRGIWVSEEGKKPKKRSTISQKGLVPADAKAVAPEGLRLVGYAPTTIPRRYANSRLGREIAHECKAALHPDTAKALGVKKGDKIQLSTRAGTARLEVELWRTIHPGTVAVPDGYGHTAGGMVARADGKADKLPVNLSRKAFLTFPFGLSDRPTQNGDPIWWQHSGPGTSLRALMPFRFTDEGVQNWGPIEVEIKKV